MSEKSDIAKLEFILTMIEDIDEISKRHRGVSFALKDVEGKHAILMCLLQIGEKINQIKNPELRKKLPITGAYSMRNFIAHDYGGVNPMLIETTVRTNIPELKETIRGILSN